MVKWNYAHGWLYHEVNCCAVQDIVIAGSSTPELPPSTSPNQELADLHSYRDLLRVKQIKFWAAHDGYILWTLANFSWLDFVLNWIAAVDQAGIDNFFVASLDAR